MNRRLSRRTGLTLAAASLLLANTTVKVLAQEASPTSSVSIPDLPSGPLGEQIQWFVDLLTGDPTAITGEAVAGHFSENALVVKSADSIAADFAALAREIGPVTVEPGSMLTTRDLPPTTGRFVIVGQDPANRLQVNINVSSASGLIEGLSFSTAPASAATPEAAAVASPVASIPDVPEGPLGEQIQWLVDLLNGDAADITGAAIEPHLAQIVLDEVPADDLATALFTVASQGAPCTGDPGSIATTRDLPPTTAQFVLSGRDGLRLLTTLSVDRETGLIAGLFFQPAPVTDAPAATPAS